MASDTVRFTVHFTIDDGKLEAYGDPGPAAAKLLAGFGAEIFQPWRGFRR